MILSETYSRSAFVELLRGLVPDIRIDERAVQLPSATHTLNEAVYIGRSPDLDVSVLEVRVEGTGQNRVALARDGFRIMRDSTIFRALVAYHAPQASSWRLSLMTATPVIDDTGAVVTQLSNPRRFSFTLGPDARVHTPEKFLIRKGAAASFADLASRFSVEVVNKEFYERIAELYTELVGGTRATGSKTRFFPGLLRLPDAGPGDRTAHEFAVRLVGRILFCWFLREKRSRTGAALIDTSILSRMAAETNDYYRTTLEPLFFEVLNRPLDSRREWVRNSAFDQVPYLNGGLFSPADDDYYHVTDPGSPSPAEAMVPDDWLRRLFEVLEQYHFTVDESTSIDIDLSIDPEMLGRIFENLLAEINPETGESARKSTGSFYTPRVIVDYMVNECLGDYLLRVGAVSPDKVDALITDDLANDADGLHLTSDERDRLIEALGEFTVLDPACGSGAFPIGVLQKVVRTLRLVDPEAQRWIQRQVRGAPPEVRRLLEREFEHKNFDYVRKLGVIRRSIYGVDIQPIATEIARLRCFLTLMVEEGVDDSLPNRGIEPLPNLDFKFVAADTLQTLPGGTYGQLGLYEDDSGIAELKSLRADYFGATSLERETLKLQFVQAQKRMLQRMLANNSVAELTRALSDWDPFAHMSTPWFDAAWMFGITDGFDAIIGNPPYVNALQFKRSYPLSYRESLNKAFVSTRGAYDLYVPFFERAVRLLKPAGRVVYISPNKYLSADYAVALRQFIFDEAELCKVLDVSSFRVFEAAAVYPLVTVLAKPKRGGYQVTSVLPKVRGVQDFDVGRFDERVTGSELLDALPDKIWGFLLSPDVGLLPKLLQRSEPLGEVASVNATSTAAEAEQYGRRLAEEPTQDALKVVNTGTIDPLRVLWGDRALRHAGQTYQTPWLSLKAAQVNSRRALMYRSPKVIVAKMAKSCEAFLDAGGDYASLNTNCIYAPRDGWDLAYLAAFCNSKVFQFIYAQLFGSLRMSGGYFQFQAPQLRVIPVRVATSAQQASVADVVSRLMSSSSQSTDDWRKLNELIYAIYDLTSDEVAVVESAAQ